MKLSRAKLLLLGGAAALGLAIPAFSQEAEETVLPPGFEDPVEQPPQQTAPPPASGVPGTAPTRRRVTPQGEQAAPFTDAALEDLEALLASVPPPVEIPDEARRPTDMVGIIDENNWGLGQQAFGKANGRFLSTLMRRIDAPLPSRWASILLRRALLSKVEAPPFVHHVDWVAERAWLLLRMGEADGARMLVQSVDVDQFTPKMFSVAVQTALATADPAGLCPLVEPGRKTSDEPVWALSDAVCAALQGEASRAGSIVDQARRRGRAPAIDLLLAEKVIGAGSNTRRAVTIEWDEVDELNSWRFGLAAATGAQIPARLLSTAQMRSWYARAPMVPLEQRLDAADDAAVAGVFSNASLMEMYSLLADGADITELNDGVGGLLRTAHAARDPNARLRAIRQIWDTADNPQDRYAKQILTAVAAYRLPATEEAGAAVPDLLGSMLSAGIDRNLGRWSAIVGGMDGEAQARAWALLAVGPAQPAVDVSAGWIGTYIDNDDSRENYKSALLVAALSGLGRINQSSQADLAEDAGFSIGGEDRWTRMLDAAVARRQPGTVVLLASAAMQTPHWRGVPPRHFYRIIRALKDVGLEYEARMIAAESLSRA